MGYEDRKRDSCQVLLPAQWLKSKMIEQPKLLLHGIDTVQCAYYLRASAGKGLNFRTLTIEKEQLRQAKTREPKAVTLGDTEFLLQPYGSSWGYPFVLTNGDFKIEVGELNNPSFFVTFRSQALWRDPAISLHEKFMAWVTGMGFTADKPELSPALISVSTITFPR
jgi:hypothetical protein